MTDKNGKIDDDGGGSGGSGDITSASIRNDFAQKMVEH